MEGEGLSGGKARRLPNGNDARGALVEALALAVGEAHAVSVVDALDVYLEEDPTDRQPAFQYVRPSVDSAIRERDEALARAARAEGELAAIKRKAERPPRKRKKKETRP